MLRSASLLLFSTHSCLDYCSLSCLRCKTAHGRCALQSCMLLCCSLKSVSAHSSQHNLDGRLIAASTTYAWLLHTWPCVDPGMISCIDFNPDDPNMMAAGSYSSVAAVYDVASGSAAFILSGHKGGITQVCSAYTPRQYLLVCCEATQDVSTACDPLRGVLTVPVCALLFAMHQQSASSSDCWAHAG